MRYCACMPRETVAGWCTSGTHYMYLFVKQVTGLHANLSCTVPVTWPLSHNFNFTRCIRLLKYFLWILHFYVILLYPTIKKKISLEYIPVKYICIYIQRYNKISLFITISRPVGSEYLVAYAWHKIQALVLLEWQLSQVMIISPISSPLRNT